MQEMTPWRATRLTTVLTRYGGVLASPGSRTALLASVLGRTSLGMTGLAVLLLVRAATGSYAWAGAVSAAYAIAFALVSPTRARSADRVGPGPVLRRIGVLHPLGFVALVAAAAVDAPAWVLAGAAALVGATVPPLGSVMRALWGELVEPGQLRTAFSLDAVVMEMCFVIGPLLVAVTVALLSPSAAVLASGALASAGALWLSANPAIRAVVPHEDRSTRRAGPLVSRVVRACLTNALCIGLGFGTIEVGVLAFVEEAGRGRESAGVVLAVWAAGSMLGGLVYGALHLPSPPGRQLPVLVVVVGSAAFLPVLAPGVVVLAALLFVCGSTIAPLSACNSLILSGAAPPGTLTEAFAWNGTMIFGGAAAGTAVAGVLVERGGASWALAGTAVTGALVILAGLRSLMVLRTSAEGRGLQ